MRTALVLVLPLLLISSARGGPQPDPSGKLRVALTGAIESLDPPRAASETARTCVANLFDQLYEYDHDARPFRLRPALATAFPDVSKDGLVQTYRLKANIPYVDDACFPGSKGRSLRASDVVFCILRLMDAHTKSPGAWMLARKVVGLDAFVGASAGVMANPARARYASHEGYPQVDGLEVVDELTFRVHLLEPLPELPSLLALAWFSVYPPEAVKAYGATLERHAVGSGPYRVLMYTGTRKLLLRRNPKYRSDRYRPSADESHGPDTQVEVRLPRNDVVEVSAYPTALSGWTAFLNGDVDLAEVPRDAFASAVDPSTGRLLPFLRERGVQLHRHARLEVFYDAFNWSDPVLGKPAGEKGLAIRTAICLATDDKWAMERLYTYQSERAFMPVPPALSSRSEAPDNPTLPQPDESRAEALEVARETLTKAGLEGGKGVPVLKMHILKDATSRRLFDLLKAQLAEIGLRIECIPLTWPEMQGILKAGKAQMWTSSWYADYPDAQNFLQLFYGPNRPEPNYTGYSNKEFDQLYVEARRLPPGPERDDLNLTMEEIVVEDCPWRPRFRRIHWSATQPWLTGYRLNDIVPKYFKYCHIDSTYTARPKK